MFGLIISGRPVNAAPEQLAEAQYAFRIPPTPVFHYIVVFLLPGAQLPPNTAATVYVQIPPSPEFKLLGGIGPGKESAIFKVSGIDSKQGQAPPIDADGDVMADDSDPSVQPGTGAAAATGDIVVGISIEPSAQVEQQLATLKSGQTPTAAPNTALVRLNSGTGGRASTKVLAQRIIANAFNFLASFGSENVPLKAFEEWWKKFERKVELDPSFLEREEG